MENALFGFHWQRVIDQFFSLSRLESGFAQSLAPEDDLKTHLLGDSF